MKILIVGAGPTGLSVAVELARRGLQPMVIDKRSSTSKLSRAVGITPRSLELLSHSGVANPLIAEGIAMEGLRVYHGKRLDLKMELRSERSFHPNLVCLAQDRTEAIMADVLLKHGVVVKYGVELAGLTETAEGVVARFSNGTEEVCDHVVGADGIKSTVRDQAGIAYPGYDLKQRWSIADVDLADWLHPGCLTVVQAEPGTVAVVVPIGKYRYRVVASRENALAAIPLSLDVVKIRREGSFVISVRNADTYSTGKIHLAGDAAHCHSPVGGRGMNLGIADAVELSRRLVDGGLNEYSHARRQEALKVKSVTERGRKMSTGINLGRRIAFQALVSAARLLPVVRRNISRFIVEF